MVSSQAWLFSVEFMCGQVLWNWGTLQTQPNTLSPWSAQPGDRNGVASPLVRSFLTYVSSHCSTAESPCSTLTVNCMKLFFAPLELLPPHLCQTFSLPLATPEQKRRSCGKRWPNWDSRHHLCKTGMFLWKVAAETIFTLKTPRTWFSKENHLRWVLPMCLKLDGEFSYTWSVLSGVQIKGHTS